MTQKILTIFGTRPEAIKMAPLVKQLSTTPGITSVVCTTGQHRTMLEQVMTANQTLNGLSRVVDVVSDWMFAPTDESKRNLLAENLDKETVHCKY